ncbi:phage capsid family protein, partial [Escherichia coli]|uniref:phage capsid family protein n=2 Tax=Pseudomonadota TaxID=1224 RepID=UPI00228287AE
MSQTTVPVGSPLARKVFGAALFANTQRQPSLMNNLTGAAPKQSAAEAKLKGQTSPDMPLVRVTDLTKSQGDQVSVDLINQTGGKPIMGDKQA